MTKIDRAEVERVIDDLEAKRDRCRHEETVLAYQYAIDRLKELL